MSAISNILTIARREVAVRIRTRSFGVATLLLVIGVFAIALLPVIISKVNSNSASRVAIVAPSDQVAARASATITTLLNPTPGTGASGSATPPPDYVVEVLPDLSAARQGVLAGKYSGALGIERPASGELQFTLYTNEPASGRTAALLRQAANAIAVGDRLDRLSIAPTDQATLFAPASFSVDWPDPGRTDPIRDAASSVGQDLLAFGMTLLIFMIVLMYGNWVAMSVVEEKSSRVMEVVLNAATPFQLLAGKVLGVGTVAFVQYAAVVIAGVTALLLQPAVSSAVLGPTSGIDVTQGLTPGLLLLFGTYGILGFLLYASLFAAAGSLVSRQEDVNAVVMPMTLLSTGGYLIGVYASTGLLDARAGWIVALTQVPFLSPFMILGRVATGIAQPWEVALSLATLALAIPIAIWVAARIYSVGVLLYGQRPAPRVVWRLLREGM